MTQGLRVGRLISRAYGPRIRHLQEPLDFSLCDGKELIRVVQIQPLAFRQSEGHRLDLKTSPNSRRGHSGSAGRRFRG
jgi:hypothetical protein